MGTNKYNGRLITGNSSSALSSSSRDTLHPLAQCKLIALHIGARLIYSPVPSTYITHCTYILRLECPSPSGFPRDLYIPQSLTWVSPDKSLIQNKHRSQLDTSVSRPLQIISPSQFPDLYNRSPAFSPFFFVLEHPSHPI